MLKPFKTITVCCDQTIISFQLGDFSLEPSIKDVAYKLYNGRGQYIFLNPEGVEDLKDKLKNIINDHTNKEHYYIEL